MVQSRADVYGRRGWVCWFYGMEGVIPEGALCVKSRSLAKVLGFLAGVVVFRRARVVVGGGVCWLRGRRCGVCSSEMVKG